MSRGNLLQGQASGKLGDTVLMVRNGQQLARVYTTSGARSGDQASEAARIQRVKFGSASNQWGVYRYVCTRMFRKGKRTSQSDYNYFVKRNAQLLPYLTKGENADGVQMLQPGLFSEGTLGRIDLTIAYNPTYAASTPALVVYDSAVSSISAVTWASTMSVLKTALRGVYPNATKVTYLVSVAPVINIELEDYEIITESVKHYPIIINLYEQASTGEDEQTVKAFFAAALNGSTIETLIGGQNGQFANGKVMMQVATTNQAQVDQLGAIGALIFATNDSVSDCYTTSLPEAGVNKEDGVFSFWAGHRAPFDLRLAAESYGFQSGVMRDHVAGTDAQFLDANAAHLARLASIDTKVAEQVKVGTAARAAAKAAETSEE